MNRRSTLGLDMGLLGLVVGGGLMAALAKTSDAPVDEMSPYTPKDDDCVIAAITENFSLSKTEIVTNTGRILETKSKNPDFEATTIVDRAEDGKMKGLTLSTEFNVAENLTTTSGYKIDFTTGYAIFSQTDRSDQGRDESVLNTILPLNHSIALCAG